MTNQRRQLHLPKMTTKMMTLMSQELKEKVAAEQQKQKQKYQNKTASQILKVATWVAKRKALVANVVCACV